MNTFKTAALIALLLPATQVAAQGGWIQLQPNNSPPARAMVGFVAMPLQNNCVLFGGEASDPGATFGDTWLWDGVDWTQAAPTTSPQAIEGTTMAYDILRDRAVLFSGWNGNIYIPETWEWDGSNWQRLTPTSQPAGRDWSAMEFDPVRAETVLFGGHDWQVAGGTLGDTWTWNGTNWTQKTVTGPSARWGHAMAFDAIRGTTILFGGAGGAGNDTWEWNGTTWTQLSPATVPTPRQWHRMAYDSVRNRIVMAGGEWLGQPQTDVWEWNGTDWAQVTVSGGPPAGGYLHGLAFDPVLQQVVHFGGSNVPGRGGSSNETWMWVSNIAGFATWRRYGQGCGAGTGSSFYELFDAANPFDFVAGSGWTMLPSASSYVVISGFNPLVTPSGTPIVFGDDQTQQVTLPWSFPGPSGPINNVFVCSNGFIALEATLDATFTESVAELLSGPMRVCPLWDDLNPGAGGTIHAEQDPSNPALFHITWTGVPEFSTTNTNDFQVTFDQTGSIEVKYGAVASLDSVVGFSPGNGSDDPGARDLSAQLPTSFTLGNDLPALSLRNQNGSRPVLGSTFVVEIVDVPPTALGAAFLISTTPFDPGIDLSAAGFGGCSLYVANPISAPATITGSTASVGLPLPSPSTLQGVTIYLQGAVLGVTNVQPLPIGFTNGGGMKVDAN